jgi:uncharacterized protein (DUF3084 family)
MTALIGGLIALILGFIGISIWWGYFLKALAAGVPIILILGGALATYLGIEEIKDRGSSDESFEPDTDGLKSEVETLKEEIRGLKEEKKDIATEKKETTKSVKEEKKPTEEEKQATDKEEKMS